MRNNLYDIRIQFEAENKITRSKALKIAERFFPGDGDHALEECESCGVRMIYDSYKLPSFMETVAEKVIRDHGGIHYIDISYSFGYDLTPDRVVIRSDGTRQEFSGRIDWTEV